MRRGIGWLAVVGIVLALAGRASAAPYGATFAGWQSISGIGIDEVSAEWTIPSVSPGAGLSEWVGLNATNAVLQAGSTQGPHYGTNCWWEDYPYNDQIAIPGLRCAPGDVVFVDVAERYFGPTQSRVIVVDTSTGQSSGWMSVYTPDEPSNPSADALVESNSTLGPTPSSFSTVPFSYATAITNGYVGSGGGQYPFNGLAYFGCLGTLDSLPGASLSENWPANVLAVIG